MHHGRTVVPPFTVRIEVQGAPLEAVVDTGVTVLGMGMFNRLQEKPPIKRPVTMK